MQHLTHMQRREFIHLAGSTLLLTAFEARALRDSPTKQFNLDPSGRTDCTEQLNALLRQYPEVALPDGKYRIATGPLLLNSGNRLTTMGNAEFLKATPPDTPLILGKQVHNISVTKIRLSNIFRATKKIQLAPGTKHFALDLALPWRYPSLTIRLSTNATNQALQYGRDFRIYKKDGISMVEIRQQLPEKSEIEVEYLTEPGLSPLIALENARDIAVDNVTCDSGAIAYVGNGAEDANLVISNCRIRDGQIRVGGEANNIPPALDATVANPDAKAPRAIRILNNQISGPIKRDSQPYYLKFTERVHGIVVSGASNFTVSGNSVNGAKGDGIWLPSASNGVVENNQFIGNGLSGIGIENTLTRVPRSKGLKISRNVSNYNWFDGCDFNYGDPSRMRSDQAKALPRGEYADNQIVNNEFVGNGQDMSEVSGGCGIYVRWVQQAVLDGNRCIDNNLAGILAEASSNLIVERNQLEKNGRSNKKSDRVGVGLALVGCIDTRISDNKYSSAAPQRSDTIDIQWKGRGADGPLELDNSSKPAGSNPG